MSDSRDTQATAAGPGGAPADAEAVYGADGAGVVNLYAQPFWHSEAWIGADRKGLMALRQAIDDALNTQIGCAEACASDGEGYDIYVVQLTAQQAFEQVVPYTDASSGAAHKGSWAGLFGPWVPWRQLKSAAAKAQPAKAGGADPAPVTPPAWATDRAAWLAECERVLKGEGGLGQDASQAAAACLTLAAGDLSQDPAQAARRLLREDDESGESGEGAARG